jgi:succinate-semialdehyde dehydrogenase/glutarate-semialdehyde dehydrogenase
MELKEKSLFKQECLIDGRWVKSADGRTIEVRNPADNAVIGTVPRLSRTEVEGAIAAAEKAWPAWRALSALQRAAILKKWAELVRQNLDDLARIMTCEEGKPLAEARGELGLGLSYMDWYAEEGKRIYGEVIPSPWPDKQPITMRQPVGVTAAITPWNFPMSMIARKAAPALAAGCPMLIKPAGATPFSALAMGELAMRAGVPGGILSVITGISDEVGDVLCQSPIVRKLSFTGSTAVGKKLIANCAGTVKKLSMELGGNAPQIICPDADIELAANGSMGSKFRNAGQTCICVNRVLVHESIHDDYVARVVNKVKGIVLGNGLNAGVTQGPQIDAKAHSAMQDFVDDAVAKGARVEIGGKNSSLGGLFYEPTVLTGVTPQMRVFREEIFGPLLPVVKYGAEEEAIRLANDTEYGLASYVFTRSLGSFYRIASALEYGLVGVNEVGLASGEVPFGGVKMSGLGREGGRQGIEDYVETKYILLAGLDS